MSLQNFWEWQVIQQLVVMQQRFFSSNSDDIFFSVVQKILWKLASTVNFSTNDHNFMYFYHFYDCCQKKNIGNHSKNSLSNYLYIVYYGNGYLVLLHSVKKRKKYPRISVYRNEIFCLLQSYTSKLMHCVYPHHWYQLYMGPYFTNLLPYLSLMTLTSWHDKLYYPCYNTKNRTTIGSCILLLALQQ